MNLLDRAKLTQTTIDTFLDKPFEWRDCDCAKLADSHLGAAGIKTPLDQVGEYSTSVGAIRGLRKIGFETLDEVLDSFLEPIPLAYAMAGDIVGFEGEPWGKAGQSWTALGVHAGGDKALAFVEIDGEVRCSWGYASAAKTAWRVS